MATTSRKDKIEQLKSQVAALEQRELKAKAVLANALLSMVRKNPTLAESLGENLKKEITRAADKSAVRQLLKEDKALASLSKIFEEIKTDNPNAAAELPALKSA